MAVKYRPLCLRNVTIHSFEPADLGRILGETGNAGGRRRGGLWTTGESVADIEIIWVPVELSRPQSLYDGHRNG
jgi:hypothetical protein